MQRSNCGYRGGALAQCCTDVQAIPISINRSRRVTDEQRVLRWALCALSSQRSGCSYRIRGPHRDRAQGAGTCLTEREGQLAQRGRGPALCFRCQHERGRGCVVQPRPEVSESWGRDLALSVRPLASERTVPSPRPARHPSSMTRHLHRSGSSRRIFVSAYAAVVLTRPARRTVNVVFVE